MEMENFTEEGQNYIVYSFSTFSYKIREILKIAFKEVEETIDEKIKQIQIGNCVLLWILPVL